MLCRFACLFDGLCVCSLLPLFSYLFLCVCTCVFVCLLGVSVGFVCLLACLCVFDCLLVYVFLCFLI